MTVLGCFRTGVGNFFRLRAVLSVFWALLATFSEKEHIKAPFLICFTKKMFKNYSTGRTKNLIGSDLARAGRTFPTPALEGEEP